MRKLVIIPVCILLIFLAACSCADNEASHGPTGPNPDDMTTIIGRYLRAGQQNLIIQGTTPILITNGSEFELSTKLDTGDLVKVKTDLIQETYPAKMEIYDFEKISSGTLDNINKEVLEKLEELGYKVSEKNK